MTIVGTCSLCGGPVAVPNVWYSTLPPRPKCQQCGAKKRPDDHGPIIEMEPDENAKPIDSVPWDVSK